MSRTPGGYHPHMPDAAEPAAGSTPVRVMLVDDSAIIRRLLGSVLDSDPGLTVVGHAANGQEALDRLAELAPDVVILDIEMPVMDGLTALPQLRRRRPDLPIIMFSTLTERGASATLEALGLGAADYVAKPSNTGSFQQTAQQITSILVPKIKALHQPRQRRIPVRPSSRAGQTPPARQPGQAAQAPQPSTRPLSRRAVETASIMSQPVKTAPRRLGPPPALVVIGLSTGGPNALSQLIPQLPANLPIPVLITQHMPPIFTRLLAERLNAQSAISVAEATDGAEPRPGEVWLAAGGHHLRVTMRAGRAVLVLDDGPPVHSCKPAVDPMFASAVQAFGNRVLGVVLTGMGNDGFDGAKLIHQAGGRVLAQDEASSVVWGMPGIIARAGLAEQILPLDRVAQSIVELAGGPSGSHLARTPAPRLTSGASTVTTPPATPTERAGLSATRGR